MAQNYWQSQPTQRTTNPSQIVMGTPPPQAVQRGLYAAQYRPQQQQQARGVPAHPAPIQQQARRQRQPFRPAVQSMPMRYGAQQNGQVSAPFLDFVRRLWGM